MRRTMALVGLLAFGGWVGLLAQQQAIRPSSTIETNHQTYTSRLIAFRKAHPALRPANFYSGVDTNGNVMEQLRWFKPDGGQAASAIYVGYSGWSGSVNFTLPWPGTGKQWYRVTDTATWNEGANTVVVPGSEAPIGGENTVYSVQARSLLLLIAK